MSTHAGLSKLYFTERKTFLAILNSIILCAPNKKTKNKLERFNFLLNKQDLYLGKVQFYIRLMHRLLINHKYQKHTKTIRVRSLMDEGVQNKSDLNKNAVFRLVGVNAINVRMAIKLYILKLVPVLFFLKM